MATLTLTAIPTNAPPKITVSLSTGNASTFTSIEVFRDGVAIRESAATGFTSAVVTDFEAPYGVSVLYTANVVTSTGLVQSLTSYVTLEATSAWLVHPRVSDLSMAFAQSGDIAGIVSLGEAQSSASASRHKVLGSGREVVMSYGVRSDIAYPSFTVRTTTEAEGVKLSNLLRDETPILVRFPESWGADFSEGFFAVSDWTATPVIDQPNKWWKNWSLPLVPAAAPKVIVQPANSYADDLLSFPTYAESLAAKATYFDRLVNY